MPDPVDDRVGDRRRGRGKVVSTECAKLSDRPPQRLVREPAPAAVHEVPADAAFLPGEETSVEVVGHPRLRLGARAYPGTHGESHRLFDASGPHIDSHHTSGRHGHPPRSRERGARRRIRNGARSIELAVTHDHTITTGERVFTALPIAAYGLLADCNTAALVGIDGSIRLAVPAPV